MVNNVLAFKRGLQTPQTTDTLTNAIHNTNIKIMGVLENVEIISHQKGITGSRNEITITRKGGTKETILVDCGTNQEKNYIETDINTPDVILLTHAHFDHYGDIRKLPDVPPIFTHNICKELLRTLLMSQIKLSKSDDEIGIQSSNVKKFLTNLSGQRITKKGVKFVDYNAAQDMINDLELHLKDSEESGKIIDYKRTKRLIKDLELAKEQAKEGLGYISKLEQNQSRNLKRQSSSDRDRTNKVRTIIKNLKGIDYGVWIEVLPGVKAMLFDAGHVLGSSQILLKIDDGRGGDKTIFASGDLGRLEGVENCDKALDIYITESTYGNREHTDNQKEIDMICDKINEAVTRGGKIIIPCFQLQRLQDIGVKLLELQEEGRIPNIPIFADGGSIDDINNIFSYHSDKYKEYLKKLTIIRTKQIKDNQFMKTKKPAIMLATGGMMTGGTIMKYINLLESPKSLLISVGFPGNGVLAQILNGEKKVYIKGTGVINAICSKLGCHSFSGHASQSELIQLALMKNFNFGAKIIINHGTPEGAETLKTELKKEFKKIGREDIQIEIGLGGKKFEIY